MGHAMHGSLFAAASAAARQCPKSIVFSAYLYLAEFESISSSNKSLARHFATEASAFAEDELEWSRANYVALTASDSHEDAVKSADTLLAQLHGILRQKPYDVFDAGSVQRLIVNVLNFKGSDLALSGKFTEASDNLRDAFAMCERLPDALSKRLLCSRILHNHGKSKLLEGNVNESQHFLVHALNMRGGSDPPPLSTLFYKGQLEDLVGRKTLALRTFAHAASICVQAHFAQHAFCKMLDDCIYLCS